MNLQVVNEMVRSLREVNRDIYHMTKIQSRKPEDAELALIPQFIGELVEQRDELNYLLEQEYMQLDITEIMYWLHI